jgi:hypothetical protein
MPSLDRKRESRRAAPPRGATNSSPTGHGDQGKSPREATISPAGGRVNDKAVALRKPARQGSGVRDVNPH